MLFMSDIIYPCPRELKTELTYIQPKKHRQGSSKHNRKSDYHPSIKGTP